MTTLSPRDNIAETLVAGDADTVLLLNGVRTIIVPAGVFSNTDVVNFVTVDDGLFNIIPVGVTITGSAATDRHRAGKLTFSSGTAATFSPAGDVAVTGGLSASTNPSDLVPDVASADATSGTFTPDSADHGQTYWFTDASEVTVDPPTDAEDDLQDGFWMAAFAAGAGGLTVDDTGLTIVPTGAKLTIAQGEGLIIAKTGVANTWLVAGGTSA